MKWWCNNWGFGLELNNVQVWLGHFSREYSHIRFCRRAV